MYVPCTTARSHVHLKSTTDHPPYVEQMYAMYNDPGNGYAPALSAASLHHMHVIRVPAGIVRQWSYTSLRTYIEV